MTTSVTVKANHGWPVSVIMVNPKTAEVIGRPQIVEKNTERTFCVHSDMDLKIHEIQPDEAVSEG